jgi:hypothetical protein
MTERYFTKFPRMNYQNTSCTDITKRVIFDSALKNKGSLFFDYTLKTNARPDLIAENYYEDPYLEWMIFLNNGIVDPYYDWYMSDYEFTGFINSKYGSIDNAERKIAYYQLNWHINDFEISVDYYENSLPSYFKKYYTPIYSYNDKILSYKRKQDKIVTNTNKIVNFTYNIETGNTFAEGEILNILSNSGANIVGQCEILFSNNSNIKVKNVSGNVAMGNKIETLDTLHKANINGYEVDYENITEDEFVYWTPVSYYNIELDKNEKNKNISLIDNKYSLEISEELRNLLKNV